MKRISRPFRFNCGLGLFDSILALGVLSIVLFWGTQMLGNWVSAKVIANDARSVAEVARAGRLMVERLISSPNDPVILTVVGAAPLEVDLSRLVSMELRSASLGTKTPGRREISLYVYRQSLNVILIMVRARGTSEITRIPGASDGVSGVGVTRQDESDSGSTEHILIGPGINYDMFAINGLTSGFATKKDIFAFEHVALDENCQTYLYRVSVNNPRCPDANRMSVDLDMGNNFITNANSVNTHELNVDHIDSGSGITNVYSNVNIKNDLEVEGETIIYGEVDIGKTLTAGKIVAKDDLEVRGTLNAAGGLTTKNLESTGPAIISGTARLGGLDITNLTTEDMTVTGTCTGCN